MQIAAKIDVANGMRNTLWKVFFQRKRDVLFIPLPCASEKGRLSNGDL
jgi:hypothetical protein